MSIDTKRIREHVLANPEAHSTCKSVARYFGISCETLRKVFWRNEGTTLGKWLRDSKIEYAKKLLRETDVPCKQICYIAGLGRDDSGSKKFVKQAGLTMSQYREESKRSGFRCSPERTSKKAITDNHKNQPQLATKGDDR